MERQAQQDKNKLQNLPERLLHRKQGAYWNEILLHEIALSTKLPESDRTYASRFINDIEDNGNDALAHLCLPAREYNILRRKGYTISAVETELASGEFAMQNRLGAIAIENISSRIKLFREKVADEEKQLSFNL